MKNLELGTLSMLSKRETILVTLAILTFFSVLLRSSLCGTARGKGEVDVRSSCDGFSIIIYFGLFLLDL